MCLLKIFTQIHNFYARQRPIGNARSQCQQFIFSFPRVVIGFHRRRRGTQQRQRAFHFRAHDGHIAPVIARCLFLFETVFLFFVDDDEPDIFQWCKHCRPRPDHDARLAVAYARPLARSFHVAQRRMQHRHALEPRAKPRPALPPDPQRQRNLRHQDERGFSACKRFLHCAQIHFGLAAAGNAVEQLHAEFAKNEPRANRLESARLLRIHFMRWRSEPRVKRIFRRINRLLPTLQQSVAQHPVDHCSRHLRQLHQLRQRQRPALRLKQLSHSFFFVFSVYTLRLCVKILLAFLGSGLGGRRSVASPRDHSLRSSASSLHRLANFNEPQALQPLQCGSVNTQFCRWPERHRFFSLSRLRKKCSFCRREPMRQFASAQAVRRLTPCLRQNNLPLRFQLRHRWQHSAENFANRRQVVSRDPMRQLDQFRRQRGSKIQHAD